MTLKEQYWKNGNIFEISTGEKRIVWEDKLMDKRGYIPKRNFNDNLVNTGSPIGEYVIRVYSPNKQAGYFAELIKTKEDNLLWQKYKFIFSKDEAKENLGVPSDMDFIIV